MKVKEIMTSSIFSVHTSHSIKEVSRFLLKHHLNSMPVVDHNSNLLGIITLADIFRALLPSQAELFREEPWNFEKIEERAKEIADRKVDKVMSSPTITVTEDTSVVQAGSTLLLKGIKQLPVVRDGELVGIVTLTDIVEALIISTPKQ